MQKLVESFNHDLHIQLAGLISQSQCRRFITDYEAADQRAVDEIINECLEQLFNKELDALLLGYFQTEYAICWPKFEVIEHLAWQHNYSTRWHLDGGVKRTLKLFVYLNSVKEHGGNTLLMDKARTEKIRAQGFLPLEYGERYRDLTIELQQLNLSTKVIAYPLVAGDVLLFNPLELAHKCLPPIQQQKRYTISYTIIPKV